MGTVVLSVDAELGWGYHDVDSPPMVQLEYARGSWVSLLNQFGEFDIPATWAVVGHLFLEDCDGVHAHHPAPSGWFNREHGEWRTRRDLRFANGLIDRIQAASTDHEIGCHSFSHVEFGAPGTTRELARAELRASHEAAGASFDSFVFPRNHVGHRDVLAEFGYRCYRGVSPNHDQGTFHRRIGKVTSSVSPDVPLVTPTIDEYGLVNVPASLFLYGFEGTVRSVLEPAIGDPIIRRARRGIDRAIREPGVFHMWLHPNNLNRRCDFQRLRAILRYLAHKRDRYGVTVETMGTVAERTQGTA